MASARVGVPRQNPRDRVELMDGCQVVPPLQVPDSHLEVPDMAAPARAPVEQTSTSRARTVPARLPVVAGATLAPIPICRTA